MSADDLGQLRNRCEALLRLHSEDAQLGKALSGLYYAFKSLKFVPPRTDELLGGDYEEVCVKSSRADEACYLAEMMIRSLHPVGDLLAQVVNICVLDSRHGRSSLSLKTVLKDPALDPSVRGTLVAIRGSHGFDYIAEFTNASKHREFVDRLVLHDDNHQRIEFQPFERRNGKSERKREFTEVLNYGNALRQHADSALKLLVDRRKPLATMPLVPAPFRGSITGTVSLDH